MIIRFDDWPEKLSAYLAERNGMALDWGVHDCCAFACGGVMAQCGVDPMAAARGKYYTQRGAAAWIKKNGGTFESVAQRLGAECGLTEIAPTMAGRGCVVLADVPTVGGVMAPALGLVGMDSRRAVFMTDGLPYFELAPRECRMAWSFG